MAATFSLPPTRPATPVPVTELLASVAVSAGCGAREELGPRLEAWVASGRPPVLDLRPPAAFGAWRLRGRTVNVPWHRLALEGFLLPPREVAVALLLPEGSQRGPGCADARDHSGGAGAGPSSSGGEPPSLSFQDLASRYAHEGGPVPDAATLLCCFTAPRNPWVISCVFVDSPVLRAAAAALGLAEEAARAQDGCARRLPRCLPPPRHHLWCPTPLLLVHAGAIEAAVLSAHGRRPAGLGPAAAAGAAASRPAFVGSCLDLGCGAGRDAAFLGLRGWDVLAVDNMPKALARCRSLADIAGVGAHAEQEEEAAEEEEEKEAMAVAVGEAGRGVGLAGRGDEAAPAEAAPAEAAPAESPSEMASEASACTAVAGRLRTALADLARDPAALPRALALADDQATGDGGSAASSGSGGGYVLRRWPASALVQPPPWRPPPRPAKAKAPKAAGSNKRRRPEEAESAPKAAVLSGGAAPCGEGASPCFGAAPSAPGGTRAIIAPSSAPGEAAGKEAADEAAGATAPLPPLPPPPLPPTRAAGALLPRGSFRGGVDLLVISRFFMRVLLQRPPPGDAEPPLFASSSSLSSSPPPPPSRCAGWAAAELVAPGGVVFWHHFRDGVQHHPLGHPSSPDDIVRPGELRQAFAGWRVLLDDEEGTLPDGRPMVTFIAQRPL